MQAVLLLDEYTQHLRPLTCTIPKPILPVLSKPILAYTLESFYAQGILDVICLFHEKSFLAEQFLKNYPNHEMHIKIVIKEEQKHFFTLLDFLKKEEPVLIVQGDHLYDFQWQEALAFHKKRGAFATLLAKRVYDPRLHCSLLKTKEGRVESFVNCPSWKNVATDFVFSDAAVLEPKAISFLAKEKCSSLLDGLETLHNFKYALYVYEDAGYWNSMSTIADYRQCQKDVLHGKTHFYFPKLAEGIFAQESLPKGEYTLLAPVYIEKDVQIANGALIGPNTILCRGTSVGKSSKIQNSMVMPFTIIQDRVTVQNAVLSAHCQVEADVKLFENTVVGEGTKVGAHSILKPNVKVWPSQHIPTHTILSHNLKQNFDTNDLFLENSLLSFFGAPLNPSDLALLGRAISCEFPNEKIGVSYQNSPLCEAAFYSLTGALTAQGTEVWCFGTTFLSALYFYTDFCTFPLGIYIEEKEGKIKLHLFERGGLPLAREIEQQIARRFLNQDFLPIQKSHCKERSNMRNLEGMYLKKLAESSSVSLEHQQVTIYCENRQIQNLLEDSLYRAKAQKGDELTFKINTNGTRARAFHRECGWVPHERLLALCCLAEAKAGKTLSMPLDAPYLLKCLAEENQQKLYRYFHASKAEQNLTARKIARNEPYSRDALFLTMRVLGILEENGKTLFQMLKEVPQFYEKEAFVSLPFSPNEIPKHLPLFEFQKLKEGILLTHPKGHALLLPSKSGKRLRILTESENYAFSKELLGNIKESLLKD